MSYLSSAAASPPATFGDVTAEYLALRNRAGATPGVHELVWVRGADTVTFLEGLLSKSVERLAAGAVARSLLLAPQGKLRALLWLLRGNDEVGIVTDAGRGAVVVEDLNRFRIRVDVDISLDDRPLVTVTGPDVFEVARSLGADPSAAWSETSGRTVSALPFTHVALPRVVVAGASLQEVVAAGATAAGRLAYDAVRIEAGEPTMGVDIDERTIPQEAMTVEGAVDFDKGCYLGQELVARIDSRGHVNRMLRGVVMRDAVLPPPGATIAAGGVEVGTLGSVAESLELRAPVGLGLVRREVEPGSAVEIGWDGGGAGATVEALPLDAFGVR